MLRKTATEDMEKSLLDDNPVENKCIKNKCIKNTTIIICLLTSYGLFYGFGFYTGLYIENQNDDGSNI